MSSRSDLYTLDLDTKIRRRVGRLGGRDQERGNPRWSPDGQSILGMNAFEPGHFSLSLWPVDTPRNAPGEGRQVTPPDPACNLSQASYSPDGRWIVFVVQTMQGNRFTIAVMPSAGGGSRQWTQLTSPEQGWADKPRWSPDGRMVYFTLRRQSAWSSNVWALRFDPAAGKAIGTPFQVTRLGGPCRFLMLNAQEMEIGVSEHRLVLPIRGESSAWRRRRGRRHAWRV